MMRKMDHLNRIKADPADLVEKLLEDILYELGEDPEDIRGAAS